MLLVRAHPDYWALYINKLACYQIGVTLYVQRALESASLPHTCNVKNLQQSAVMSKVCFDFFIAVLTFEKEG